jgi:hypothetical protein
MEVPGDKNVIVGGLGENLTWSGLSQISGLLDERSTNEHRSSTRHLTINMSVILVHRPINVNNHKYSVKRCGMYILGVYIDKVLSIIEFAYFITALF